MSASSIALAGIGKRHVRFKRAVDAATDETVFECKPQPKPPELDGLSIRSFQMDELCPESSHSAK